MLWQEIHLLLLECNKYYLLNSFIAGMPGIVCIAWLGHYSHIFAISLVRNSFYCRNGRNSFITGMLGIVCIARVGHYSHVFAIVIGEKYELLPKHEK